jgi:hypothetical protein
MGVSEGRVCSSDLYRARHCVNRGLGGAGLVNGVRCFMLIITDGAYGSVYGRFDKRHWVRGLLWPT